MIAEKLKMGQTTELILRDKDGKIKEHREVVTRNGVKTETDMLTNKVIDQQEVI